jgi:phage baseplate assembly protein V
MIRGVVKSVLEGVIKRFSASGRSDETITDREYFQHYGYTSRPKAGAEIIIIREGGHFVAVASDDRRYRISLEEGEVALYDDLGQKVHLTRSGINVTSPLKITATAPNVDIVASVQVSITSPLVQISDNVTIGGTLEVTGEVTGLASITAAVNVSDAGGAKTMSGMRQTFDNHTHAHPADGVTIPAPTGKM